MNELGLFLDSVPFSQIIIFILGVLSVITILDKHVPIPVISKYLRDSEERRLERILKSYFEGDEYKKFKENVVLDTVNETLNAYFNNSYKVKEQERLELRQLFRRLNITNGDIEKLRVEIEAILKLPFQTEAEQVEVIEEVCKCSNVIVDQTDEKAKLYKEVDYYLNFVDVMNVDLVADRISVIVANRVKNTFRNLSDSFILVPVDGNYLLGYKVASILGLPFIMMRSSPRVLENQYWDGDIRNKKNAIMVHDVGVTSNRLVDSANLLVTYSSAAVNKIFMLVDRMDENGKGALKNNGLAYEAVLVISSDKELLELKENVK